MLRHLLKLIWKRKGRNVMLSLEILLAFVIVFAIAAFALRNWQVYRHPTGFVAEDVWSVYLHTGDQSRPMEEATYQRFKRDLEAMPQVEKVAFASTSPYRRHTMETDIKSPASGREVIAEVLEFDEDVMPLLKVTPLHGRLFELSDNAGGQQPAVINRRMALAMFGSENAVGRTFASPMEGRTNELVKVVGVIEDYRSKGELDAPGNVVIVRYRPTPTSMGIKSVLLKVGAGTTRAFEQDLNRQLKLLNNTWSYEITPLSSERKMALKSGLMPIVILSTIAAFLLLMVAFGLFGVLWQNTTRRIPEIGLRRAIGASAGNIYRQIMAEQCLLSTVAMLAALLLLVQLPLTGVLGDMLNWQVFAAATAVSMTVIYLLSLLCSVYPGWRASRLSPTEALHHE